MDVHGSRCHACGALETTRILTLAAIPFIAVAHAGCRAPEAIEGQRENCRGERAGATYAQDDGRRTAPASVESRTNFYRTSPLGRIGLPRKGIADRGRLALVVHHRSGPRSTS